MGYEGVSKFWSKGGVLLVIGLGIVGLIIYKSMPRTPSEEVTAAKTALDKLQSATDIGINLPEYNRLVIESQSAIYAAERRTPSEMPEAWAAMRDAMQAHKDAHAAWRVKASGKRLWDTPEGSAIRWKLKMEASKTEDDVIQECWSIARLKTFELDAAVSRYRNGY